MTVNQMRNELMKFYGDNWKQKVAKMSDNQVIAVYRKFQSKGQIR